MNHKYRNYRYTRITENEKTAIPWKILVVLFFGVTFLVFIVLLPDKNQNITYLQYTKQLEKSEVLAGLKNMIKASSNKSDARDKTNIDYLEQITETESSVTIKIAQK